MHAARSAADFLGAALFCWPVFLAHFLKKPNAEERPMFLFGTPFPHVLSFGSRGAMFLKKCVLSCGSLLYPGYDVKVNLHPILWQRKGGGGAAEGTPVYT